ncbi:hypothetical protein JI664_13365 [Rhodobacter sp. NTK016B]|uniref:hypothetical protein n=1 Tax=Rhodobacter sp. NTK016B TaxID=2759676 RepID=UPI001A8FAE30|nr:hypothetical protein [Rhodobacter sp. NTK016B]MBN8292956.1 hypothetical protein [Rhodobacter sp. NTK016B]
MIRLIRFTLFRFAPVAFLLAAVIASPARAEFTGGGYITDAWGCEDYGFPTQTEMVRARYSAREIDGGASELVLNFAVGGANILRVWNELDPGNGWMRAYGNVVWGRMYSMGPQTWVRVLAREGVPFASTTFDEHSEHIRLRLRITNFNGMRGCGVTVTLMLNNWTNNI